MHQLKKILFVHHVSLIGGASYCLLNVVKALDRSRYLPIVLLRNDGPLVEELKKMKVDVIFCPSLRFYPYNRTLFSINSLLTIFNIFRSFDDFENILKRYSPEIVYFNNTFLFPYLKISHKRGVKSVIHIREHWPADQHQKQFRYLQQEIMCRADKIIAINDYSARMISPDLSKVTIVYDWIDFSERYEYQPFNEIFGEDVSHKKVYIYTGGMQRIKGTYEVVKAFSEVVKDNNSRLLVLGVEKENSVKGWKSMIKYFLYNLGILSYDYKVRSIVQNDKRIECIPSTYNISHIFEQAYCMLSYFTKPHANLALAEAICLQLPCIAAETEESVEYSMDGELAYLFPINNMAAFESMIQNINRNYPQIKSRLAASSEIIAERFNKEKNSERLRSLLDEL